MSDEDIRKLAEKTADNIETASQVEWKWDAHREAAILNIYRAIQIAVKRTIEASKP